MESLATLGVVELDVVLVLVLRGHRSLLRVGGEQLLVDLLEVDFLGLAVVHEQIVEHRRLMQVK